MEKIIEQRKEEAYKRGILAKAGAIAMKLGTRTPKKHGANYNYSRGDESWTGSLSIWFDDYGNNASISWSPEGRSDGEDTRVFRAQLGNVTAYRPDIEDWYELLDAIFQREVEPLLKVEREKEKKREAKELHDAWGINEIPEEPRRYDTWIRWTEDLDIIEKQVAIAKNAIKLRSMDLLEKALNKIESLVESRA